MKWILCGKNDPAVSALEWLVEQGDEVRVIATADDDAGDGWQRSLAAAADRMDVPCDRPRRINDAGFVARLAKFGADALFSIQYDQILHGRLFRALGCPCLNFHFSLLPRHRGVSPVAFAVLAGDREAGVTLHHMVEAIDAGDLIAQRAVAVRSADTAREVYDRISAAAAELFRESYPFDERLLATRIGQDESTASYHRQGDFDFSARAVDWSQEASVLQRWLRAMIFPPFQHPEAVFEGRRLPIERVAGEVGAPTSAPPGTVVARSGDTLDVAASGGSIRIVGPGAEATIAVGDRFTLLPQAAQAMGGSGQ